MGYNCGYGMSNLVNNALCCSLGFIIPARNYYYFVGGQHCNQNFKYGSNSGHVFSLHFRLPCAMYFSAILQIISEQLEKIEDFM